MADFCNPKNLFGALEGRNRDALPDLLPEFQRTKSLEGNALFNYEAARGKQFKNMAAEADAKDAKTKNQEMREKLAGMGYDPADPMTYIRYPSETIPRKVWKAVDTAMTDWAEGRATFKDGSKVKAYSKSGYMQVVAPRMRKLATDIRKAVLESKGKAALQAKLGKAGMKPDQVTHTLEYLDWAANGGPFQKDRFTLPWIDFRKSIAAKKPVGTEVDILGNLSTSAAAWNPKWTLGNLLDMGRVVGNYSDNPGAVVRGAMMLRQELGRTGKNVFQRLPELEKAGAYNRPGGDQPQLADADFFSRSVIAQKNMVWYIDKAAGGDGWRGLRDNLFESRPWDVQPVLTRNGSRYAFGFMRFTLGDFSSGMKYTNGLLQGLRTGNSADIKRYGVPLLVTASLKYALTGAESWIPAPIWALMSASDQGKETQQGIRGLDEASPVANLIKKSTGINLAEYNQFAGGALFVTGRMAGDLIGKTWRSLGKAAGSVSEGRADKAAVQVSQAASTYAALRYGVPMIWGKGLDILSKAMEGEYDTTEELFDEVREKYFGKQDSGAAKKDTKRYNKKQGLGGLKSKKQGLGGLT